MVLTILLVEQANEPELLRGGGRRPTFAVELQLDEYVDFLSLKVVEDGLQRLPFQRDTVAPPRPQFLDDLRVRIGLYTGDEPAVISVTTVEQPEIVEAEIEQDEGVSYPLAGG